MRILAGLALALCLAFGLAACGGDSSSSSETTPAAEETTSTTEETTSTTEDHGETSTTEETGGATSADGAEVFASAGCGGCHTLSAAGTSGTIGPNLDDLAPSTEQVVKQVENGGGAMPAFKDDLTPDEIQAVAEYVSSSAGS